MRGQIIFSCFLYKQILRNLIICICLYKWMQTYLMHFTFFFSYMTFSSVENTPSSSSTTRTGMLAIFPASEYQQVDLVLNIDCKLSQVNFPNSIFYNIKHHFSMTIFSNRSFCLVNNIITYSAF